MCAVYIKTAINFFHIILCFLYFDVEPAIRMSILDTVPVLLDHHSRLCHSDSENSLEAEERLFDVPIRMVSDINQQVCVCVCACVCVCVHMCVCESVSESSLLSLPLCHR